MSIGMSPFKQIYAYDSSTIIGLIFCDSIALKAKDSIKESKKIWRIWKKTYKLPKINKKNTQTNIEWKGITKWIASCILGCIPTKKPP